MVSILSVPIPPALFAQIIKKMDIHSLCRLRKASKAIDNFVEENRFLCPVRSQMTSVFVIKIERNAKHSFKLILSSSIPLDMQFETAFTEIDRYVYNKKIEIKEPFWELSAFKIDNVYIRVEEDPRTQLWFLENILVPQLASLQLKCDRLMIRNVQETIPSNLLDRFCSSIQFDVPVFHMSLSSAYAQQLPLQNCESVQICEFKEEINLCSFARNFKRVELGLALYRYEGRHMIIEFLQEISFSTHARGKLEYLSMWWDFHLNPSELQLPGVEILWHDDHVSFYKMIIPCGFVVFSHQKERGFYVFYIIPDDNRKELLRILGPQLFLGVPYDFSVHYDEFLNAESDYKAFSLLVERHN